MDEDRRVSRLPLAIFAALTAVFAVAAFFVLRQALHEAHRARLGERDLRLLQLFQSRAASRVEAVRMRIEGAELLIAATPPSASTAARALAFAMREGAEEGYLAAVVLDERGGVIASRRKGSVPPPGEVEKNLWAGGVAALRKPAPQGKPAGERHHIDAGALSGVPVIFLTAPSPSTKGYWGVILPAEGFLPLQAGELGSRDSVFLLAEPDQNVLYARTGAKFLYESAARAFDKGLASALEMVACCDPAAFNTVNEGERWMAQARFSGGTRDLLLVRVADRRETGASLGATDRLIGGGLVAGWAILVGAFAFLGAGRAARGEERAAAAEGPGADRPPASFLAAVSRVGECVARGDHFREVIALAAGEGARLVGADRFYSALYEDTMDQLLEVSSSRLGEGYRAAVAMGSGNLPERIAVRERDIVEVTSLDEWEDAPETFRQEGVKAAAVFPLRAGERVVGVMSYHFEQPRELKNHEMELCSILALQGATAVARALSLAEPPPER